MMLSYDLRSELSSSSYKTNIPTLGVIPSWLHLTLIIYKAPTSKYHQHMNFGIKYVTHEYLGSHLSHNQHPPISWHLLFTNMIWNASPASALSISSTILKHYNLSPSYSWGNRSSEEWLYLVQGHTVHFSEPGLHTWCFIELFPVMKDGAVFIGCVCVDCRLEIRWEDKW
jgi:hypothetical protein